MDGLCFETKAAECTFAWDRSFLGQEVFEAASCEAGDEHGRKHPAIKNTSAVSREANLGHVQSGACCAIQPSETCIAVTKVFINLNVSLCGLLKNKFKTMLESKSTPRSYPPYLVVKTRRSNYDPVLELYYYKSIRCRLRREKTPRKKSLQESMGAWGAKSSWQILINLSSRLCRVH